MASSLPTDREGYLKAISQLPRTPAGQQSLSELIERLLGHDDDFLRDLINFGGTVLGLFKRVLLQSVQGAPSYVLTARMIALLSKTLPFVSAEQLKESRIVSGLKTLVDFHPPGDVLLAVVELLRQLNEKVPSKLLELVEAASKAPPKTPSTSFSSSSSSSSSSSASTSTSTTAISRSSSPLPPSHTQATPSETTPTEQTTPRENAKRPVRPVDTDTPDNSSGGQQQQKQQEEDESTKVQRTAGTSAASTRAARNGRKTVRWADESLGKPLCSIRSFAKDRYDLDGLTPQGLTAIEPRFAWYAPPPIRVAAQAVKRGCDSKQRLAQKKLERSTLATCYTSEALIPPSPAEPETTLSGSAGGRTTATHDTPIRSIVDNDPLDEIDALLIALGFTSVAQEQTLTQQQHQPFAAPSAVYVSNQGFGIAGGAFPAATQAAYTTTHFPTAHAGYNQALPTSTAMQFDQQYGQLGSQQHMYPNSHYAVQQQTAYRPTDAYRSPMTLSAGQKKPCFFFNRGRGVCKNGDKCTYLHEL